MGKLCGCGHERLGLTIVGGVLRWRAVGSKHRLRNPPGWAIQKSVLAFHRAAGDVLRVEIVELETSTTFGAALSQFFVHGVELDRGYGKQIALPLRAWHMAGAGETVSASSASAGADMQLTFFDVLRGANGDT